MKSTMMWAVFDPQGEIQEGTLRIGQRYSISAFCSNVEKPWGEFYLKGYSCRRVNVVIEELTNDK